MRLRSPARAARTASWLVASAMLAGCGGAAPVEHLVATVHATRPHDPSAFTQGLEVADGVLYESSGGYGTSDLRAIDLATGAVVGRRVYGPDIFAEGLAVAGDRVVQLTWKSGRAYVLARSDLRPVGTLSYTGEGWGLCAGPDGWIMSDGTDTLTVRDRDSFRPIRTIHVRLEGVSVDRLNELECVDGRVYANVWQTDEIMRIESSGRVSAVIDASGLPVTRPDDPDAVLNGIAALPGGGRFLLTGKLWPSMFEVSFEPRP
jgi:glutaminyl-peptide cyclotransferase